MKKLAILAMMVGMLLAGCATPSYESYTWDSDGNLINKVVKYENSTFALGKALLFQIGYDPSTYSPTIRFGYGRYESARIFKDGKYTSDMKFTDVNIFSGAGSLNHKITINNAEMYNTAPDVIEEPVPPMEPVELPVLTTDSVKQPPVVESGTVVIEPAVQ